MSTFQFVIAVLTAIPGVLAAIGALLHSRSVSARVTEIEARAKKS